VGAFVVFIIVVPVKGQARLNQSPPFCCQIEKAKIANQLLDRQFGLK
jgi:hypothetical protein